MTKDELLQFFDGLDFGREFKKFVSLAQQRLNAYGKPLDSDLGGVTAKDIVQGIFLRLLEKPDNIPRGIDVDTFRFKISNKINNAVRLHLRKPGTMLTASFDPMEEITDDQFFDFVTAETELEAKLAEQRILNSKILDAIAELLEEDDLDAWFVLSDLRDGKKPGQIAEDNNIDIKDVRNLVKRINRLIATKATIPVRHSIF